MYPLTIEQRLFVGEDCLRTLLLPYSIPDDVAHDKYGVADAFCLVLTDEALLAQFCESLKVFCRAKQIRTNEQRSVVLIDENPDPMDDNAFREFRKIICDSHCVSIQKPEPEPIFNTEEGRKTWLKLQEHRAKNARPENDFINMMISVVQFGGPSYIDESIVSKWTIWKLVTAYRSIIESREYQSSFDAFLQGGDRKLIRQHWTERLKPSQEIK